MSTKPLQTKNLYFTSRLLKELNSLWEHPLTIVEAPMGYGKTTAVKHLLNNWDGTVLWLRVYDDSVDNFWEALANLLGELNDDLNRSLIHLGVPDDTVSLRAALRLMKCLDLSEKCVLVIDDYHLLDSPEIDGFITALIENEVENLHIVLTQRYTKLQKLEELSLKGLLYHITKDAFELKAEDIVEYYRSCGVSINEEQAGQLYLTTEGWISALYLMLLSFIEDGVLQPPESIYKLIEKTVYAPLSGELKEFSIKLSIFDKLTPQQVTFIWGTPEAAELLAAIVNKNAFVSYDSRTKTYQMHSIFREYLRDAMDKKNSEYKNALYQKAADWYLENRDYTTARQFWYACGDFESILLSIEEEKAKTFTKENMKTLRKYLDECPAEIKSRHHYALLILSVHFLLHNKFEAFMQTFMEVGTNISSDDSLSDRQRNMLYGELELLHGVSNLNNLKQMTAYFENAWQLLGGPTSIFDMDADWTHGAPSVLYLYYRKSGKLRENLEDLKNGLPCYECLTQRNGSGGGEMMEAELYYHMGDMVSAEIALNKALHKARLCDQWGLVLAAMFLQMRVDWMKGDFEHMFLLLAKMREEMSDRVEYQYLNNVELCEMSFYAQLDQKYKIPESLARPESGEIQLLHASYSMFNIIYGRVLLINEQYTELLGSAEYFLETATFYPNLLGVIYTYIYMAAANWKIHRSNDARESLKKAIDIAMPDALYMPFVENGDYIEPLIREYTAQGVHQEQAQKILTLYETYAAAKEKIKQTYFNEEKPELTDREAEIARLAAGGMTNKEIADKLFISANTVKFTLKSVFSKLSISSRALLRQHFGS